MFRLMELELRRNKLRPYVIVSIVTSVTMTAFLFLLAYAPHIDSDPDLQIFIGYRNLTLLFSAVNMAIFATLSATMYSRFVVEEYKGKRAILLLSYPVERDKIMLAKLAVVFLFVFFAMTLSSLLAFGIFSVSETIAPLVDEALSLQTLLRALRVATIMAIIAAEIGIMAVGVGFIKKSVPATIISAALLSSLFCNIMLNVTSDAVKSDMTVTIFISITTLAGMMISVTLMKMVANMEVE